MIKLRNAAILLICMVVALIYISGCGDSDEDEEGYDPKVDPQDFVAKVDNPYFPLTPGTTYIHMGETEDGAERIEVNVTGQTRTVLGVTCIVVRDRVWVDENEDNIWGDTELVEDTFDWYAQDNAGNVWYMGEDSKEYEEGVVVSTEGSWEAGVDGAKPVVIVWAEPEIGVAYRQEYYEDEAEDMAKALGLNESVTVPYGSFDNCLKTEEWSPLDPGVVEQKYYAPGIGVILEVMVQGGSDQIELAEVIEP